jgi:phosphate transport system protein
MLGEHTVKSYNDELKALKRKVTEMGESSERQLSDAARALVERDTRLAEEIVRRDTEVDTQEEEIQTMVVRLLALRQPMAIDLRSIIAALKISTDLERVADYSANVARHVAAVDAVPMEPTMEAAVKMARIARAMLTEAMDAYQQSDARLAGRVWRMDHGIDEIYARQLLQVAEIMREEPRHLSAYTAMLFVFRCLERIGDHIANVTEHIYFLVRGESFPKKEMPADVPT